MRVRMGADQYFSKCADIPTGEWNEGFVFRVSYHAQLFNTIEVGYIHIYMHTLIVQKFDLYDKSHKIWSSAMKHIGKAKLKLSSLSGREKVFVTFLPIYEYRSHRLLPADYKPVLSNIIDKATISKNVGDLHLIGSVQVRIRYQFQHPVDSPRCLPSLSEKGDTASSQLSIASSSRDMSFHSTNQAQERRTSYGRSDLVRNQNDVSEIFQKRLTRIMSTRIPSEQGTVSDIHGDTVYNTYPQHESSQPPSRSSSQEHMNQKQIQKHHRHIYWFFKSLNDFPKSTRGRRYGFSQTDSDDHIHFNPDNMDSASHKERHKVSHKARKKAEHIIHSVNFGDRNFASQWMQDSFDDVALSHPMVDKLIGMVVSKQTRAMVRAIIKTANAFGQGFRATGLQMLKAALIIQKFYELRPMPPFSKPIQNIAFIDDACHYFGFALIAYGWRGLCYLGAYGQYVRGFKDRRSNRMAIIRYLQLNPEDLLGYEYSLRKGASFQPSYYVAIDRSRKAIVLSIRGTWSLYDAITDLVCEYVPWKGGLVHSGMLASAQWFYTGLIPQIFRYIYHHNEELERFIITGHSLGGGTASLLMMMVANHVDELRSLTNNPLFDVHCYNYAPAAVCSIDLGKKYEQFIDSFVCHDDIVGRLSYGSAMKLKELILDTISTYTTLGGFRKTMAHAESRKVCFDIIRERLKELNNVSKTMYPSLYIPGKVIQILRAKENKISKSQNKDENEDMHKIKSRRSSITVVENVSKHIPGTAKVHYTLHYITSAISDEMTLTKTCIEDHMISAYQNAFTSIKDHYLKDD
ncbi:hypothetical protein RMCBS344292_18070 [Rhizopus microsporus]|nr:hypothetical protein RMCBS344292_18070 [Rhizopus microsporus]